MTCRYSIKTMIETFTVKGINKMRKWLFVLSAILVLGVLAACGSNGAGDNAGQGGDNNEEASLEDIFLQVKDVIIEDLEEAGVEEPIVDGKLSQYFEINLTESGEEETEFYLERLGIE